MLLTDNEGNVDKVVYNSRFEQCDIKKVLIKMEICVVYFLGDTFATNFVFRVYFNPSTVIAPSLPGLNFMDCES